MAARFLFAFILVLPLGAMRAQTAPVPPVVDSVVLERSACNDTGKCPGYRVSISSTGVSAFLKDKGKPHSGKVDLDAWKYLMRLVTMSDLLAVPKSLRGSEDLCNSKKEPTTLVTLTLFGKTGSKRIEDDMACLAKVGPATGTPKLTPAQRLMGLRGFEANVEQIGQVQKWLKVP